MSETMPGSPSGSPGILYVSQLGIKGMGDLLRANDCLTLASLGAPFTTHEQVIQNVLEYTDTQPVSVRQSGGLRTFHLPRNVASTRLSMALSDQMATLMTVAVHTDMRKHGIGTRLVRAAARHAIEAGATTLYSSSLTLAGAILQSSVFGEHLQLKAFDDFGAYTVDLPDALEIVESDNRVAVKVNLGGLAVENWEMPQPI